MDNYLLLYRDGRVIREIALGPASLEIGSAADADIVIEDACIAARCWLVQARGGSVWLRSLEGGGERVFPLDTPLALGARHRLVRTCRPRAAEEAGTRRLSRDAVPLARWTLTFTQRGGDKRRLNLAKKPLILGSGADCDVVICDPTVSARHCRLDPEGGSLTIRDLGSTNGTFLRGTEVRVARIEGGAQLRIGRTDVTIAKCTGEPQSFVAASPPMRDLLVEAERAATIDWPLLLLGPSGSGKEGLARFLHEHSARAGQPFVSENAAAIPRELVESHLFGHEKGAFTGACAPRRGLFEQAHGGTLLLDEIGELPLDQQARLLRVLETWQIRRVGSESVTHVDVRLICATHRNLPEMVQLGTFRSDLYFRLARMVLQIPPLAERSEDISALAEHFLSSVAPQIGPRSLSAGALRRLLAHDWPGNVRELRNVLEQAAFYCPGPVIESADLERAIERGSASSVRRNIDAGLIARTLARCDGNMSEASRLLSTPRSTLRDRLRRAQSSPSLAMSSSSSPK